MTIIETEDPCLFYVQFESKKEENLYKEHVRKWSGKKRVTQKQWNAWVTYVIKEMVKLYDNERDSGTKDG